MEECEGGQSEEETDLEQAYDSLEIVKQTALDHFNAILQNAQRLAVEAKKDKSQKCQRKYNGKLSRTLLQRKKHQEDLAHKGFLSVSEFMAHVDDQAKKKACLGELVRLTLEASKSEESGPEVGHKQDSKSEKSVPDLLITAALESKCVCQVHHRELLMLRD